MQRKPAKENLQIARIEIESLDPVATTFNHLLNFRITFIAWLPENGKPKALEEGTQKSTEAAEAS